MDKTKKTSNRSTMTLYYQKLWNDRVFKQRRGPDYRKVKVAVPKKVGAGK